MISHFFLSHLSVSSLIWRGRPAHDVARSMMRLGLTHLELAAHPLAPGHYRAGENNSRLFNLMAEAGVSVAALRLTGMSAPEKVDAIAEAGERGIPVVIDRAEKLLYPDLLDRVIAYSMHAAGNGVQFVLENHYYSTCSDAYSQRALKRDARQPALGFGFAPVYAVADNLDPIDEIQTLGTTLRLAYLWDVSRVLNVGTFEPDFRPGPAEDQIPGARRGLLDWREYFRALARIRFRGIFNLKWLGADHWNPEQTERALSRAVRFCHGLAIETGLDRHSEDPAPRCAEEHRE